MVLVLSGCLESSDGDVASGAALGTDPDTGTGGGSNSAPNISGAPPASVIYGSQYSFTPSSSDPDGDTLSFSASNCPTWLNFSSQTGSLSGAPSLGDVGIHQNIEISVSDGELTSTLPAFEIEVIQNADGTITISITAPTENTDGTTLTDLAGYRVYVGESEGVYSREQQIDTAGISTYVIENLLPGGMYFIAATAVNTQGVESALSNSIVRVASN